MGARFCASRKYPAKRTTHRCIKRASTPDHIYYEVMFMDLRGVTFDTALESGAFWQAGSHD
jgi:hypothetical protein